MYQSNENKRNPYIRVLIGLTLYFLWVAVGRNWGGWLSPYAFVWFGLWGGLTAFVLACPLSYAYITGLRWARDPHTRTTPGSPWFYFSEQFWPLMKRAFGVWAIFAFVALNIDLALYGSIAGGLRTGSMLFQALGWVNFMAFCLAPFCERANVLTVLLTISYGLFFLIETLILKHLFPFDKKWPTVIFTT